MAAGHDRDAGDAQRARGPVAETYLRVLAEAELGRIVACPRHQSPGASSVPRAAPAAAEGMDRVRAAAEALNVIGAIQDAAAHRVLTEFTAALAVRAMVPLRVLQGVPGARWNQPRLPAPGLPGGVVQVVPVDRSLPGGRDGELLRLLTLTMAPGRAAALTIAGRVALDRRLPRRELPIGPFGPYSLPDLGLTFTDDRGTRYDGEISGGGTCDGTWWALEFFFSPRPHAGIGWLDITAVTGPATIRVDMAGAAASFVQAGGPLTQAGADDGPAGLRGLPPAGAGPPGERLLDSVAENLLWSWLWHDGAGPEPRRLAAMAAALAGTGAVQPGSPALNRYAALSRRLGIPARDRLQGTGAAAELPQAWSSVLASRGTQDGREDVIPVAAVLPEIDGARYALTGLYSSAGSATLRALAWGWQPEEEPLNKAPFSWWARDNAGRWHVARQVWSDARRDGAVLDITLIPPLHPAATSLKIIVTGPSGRATAMVPLPPASHPLTS
jgi:hypothetical protein